MSVTITLDKHEMVVDIADYEALQNSHKKLLKAIKDIIETDVIMPIGLELKAQEAIKEAVGLV